MGFAFDDDTRAEKIDPGRWQLEITPNWNVHSYPNGGYIMAAMVRSMLAEIDKPDPLTVTAHYLRPTSVGSAAINVDVFRSGKTHTHAQASLIQGTERVRILAAFGNLHTAVGPTIRRLRPP